MREESPQFAAKWRVVKACARCHRLKSKCVYEDPTYSSCRRCYELGVKCSVDEDPTAENARRRNNTKLALQVALRIDKLLHSVEKELQLMDAVQEDECAQKFALLSARLQAAGAKLAASKDDSADKEFPDIPIGSNLAHQLIYTHGIITEEEARLRYEYFLTHMLVFYPIISLPYKLGDFEELLEQNPVLLMTCVLVTSVNDNGISERSANRELNHKLNHYVNWFLAHHIYIQASDFSFHLVAACLILSLWCVPPRKVGQFKSQIDLMCSFSLSLCIDVGNVALFALDVVLRDESVERNNLRSFLGLYCSCGSLGFSLPRFNFVAWSRRHELAVLRLLTPLPDLSLPTRNDRFLCYYAKVTRVGQELFDFFQVNGVNMHFLSSDNKSNGLGGLHVSLLEESGTMPLANITAVLKTYESTLSKTISESGFIEEESLSPRADAPKEKYALLLTYYQLMMMAHDNLVSWCIMRITGEKPQEDTSDSLLITQHVIKFGEVCEKILQCFVEINSEPTTNYPTFFYYRPLHALISLIRLLILVKSEVLTAHLTGIDLVHFKLQEYYEKVTRIVERNETMFDLSVCKQVSVVLQRINKWVNLVTNYDRSRGNLVSLDFIKLTDMSKGQEIEKLKPPPENPRKKAKLSSDTLPTPVEIPQSTIDELPQEDFPEMLRFAADPTEVSKYTTNYSIQEIFKELDEDILRYLNPYEPNLDVDNQGSSLFTDFLAKEFEM